MRLGTERKRMREITDFSLERHAGEYETWPGRSRLLRDGVPLSLTLPGYTLLRQYRTVDGYLFVTDYDCPYEEVVNFILTDKKLGRILGERSVGWMYASFWLDDLFWQDERNFAAVLSGKTVHFTIRKFSIPYLRPKLGSDWPVSIFY